MAKTILIGLGEAARLLVARIQEVIPEYGFTYDYRPYLQLVLDEIFVGERPGYGPTAKDLLRSDIQSDEDVDRINTEISRIVIDVVANVMPTLTTAKHIGYTFQFMEMGDVRIVIPDIAITEPEPDMRGCATQLEFYEQIKQDVEDGHYVSPQLRRLIGC